MEERHVDIALEGEREEIRQIFRAKGFTGEALESAVDVITAKRERWIETVMPEEHGLPFDQPLAGQGRDHDLPRLYRLRLDSASALHRRRSTAMTGFTFFAIGSLRSYWSPAPRWGAGIETFLIGITAAAIAYLVGVVLAGLA